MGTGLDFDNSRIDPQRGPSDTLPSSLLSVTFNTKRDPLSLICPDP